MERIFLKQIYIGADDDRFKSEFIEYLKNIIETGDWSAMSEYSLYLQGAKKAIEEIIKELENV